MGLTERSNTLGKSVTLEEGEKGRKPGLLLFGLCFSPQFSALDGSGEDGFSSLSFSFGCATLTARRIESKRGAPLAVPFEYLQSVGGGAKVERDARVIINTWTALPSPPVELSLRPLLYGGVTGPPE